jgi:fumarate reductase subunit D
VFKLQLLSFIIVLLFIVGVLSPLALIWAINTLFPVVAIEYSFINWLAVLVVLAVTRSEVSFKK